MKKIMDKVQYVDIYNAALLYCFGSDVDIREIIKLFNGIDGFLFDLIIKILEPYLKLYLKFFVFVIGN